VTSPSLDVDELFAILAAGATARDGESINLLAHALQCADLLAERAPGDRELQVAGLVHDIGTNLSPDQPATHAVTGADAIRSLLGERVATLVAAHDQAKRYLVTVDDDYRARLSGRSIETLAEQGGLLDASARQAFEDLPDFEACVTLRRADDDAKVPGHPTAALATWRPVVESLLTTRPEADGLL
jgi:predicted HD phosphohydrolase